MSETEERRSAGPVGEEGEALRAGASSTSPSSPPPAEGTSGRPEAGSGQSEAGEPAAAGMHAEAKG